MARSTGARSVPISMRNATFGFVIIGLMIAALGSAVFARNQRQAYQSAALELAGRVRLQGAELDLSRSLQGVWDRMTAVAVHIKGHDVDADLIDAAFGSDSLVGWAGLVSGDGKVLTVAAEPAVNTGADSPWLRAGLAGPYAGLAAWPDASTATQALVLAQPVSGGVNAGVLVAVLPTQTLAAHLAGSATALRMDFFLTISDGTVIASTAPMTGASLDLPSLRSAAAGLATSQQETWADGETYFTSVMSLVAYGDMPAIGWRLIGRVDPVEFAAAKTALGYGSLRLGAVLLLAIGGLTALFVGNFVAPFEAMARNLHRIAEGHEDYPYEGRQTKEIAAISAALVRIKGNIGS